MVDVRNLFIGGFECVMRKREGAWVTVCIDISYMRLCGNAHSLELLDVGGRLGAFID